MSVDKRLLSEAGFEFLFRPHDLEYIFPLKLVSEYPSDL